MTAVPVSSGRVELSWQAVSANGTRYRVELESRVPEGRTILSTDTEVEEALFRPPVQLTDSRAAVKVRVTTRCPTDDGSRLRETPATFWIDTSPLCPAPVRIALSADRKNLEWPGTPGAVRYDVSLRRESGDALAEGQTLRPRFAMPETSDAIVAVVRPYCETGFGPRGLALIASDAR
jgi:hypothetical protein